MYDSKNHDGTDVPRSCSTFLPLSAPSGIETAERRKRLLSRAKLG